MCVFGGWGDRFLREKPISASIRVEDFGRVGEGGGWTNFSNNSNFKTMVYFPEMRYFSLKLDLVSLQTIAILILKLFLLGKNRRRPPVC